MLVYFARPALLYGYASHAVRALAKLRRVVCTLKQRRDVPPTAVQPVGHDPLPPLLPDGDVHATSAAGDGFADGDGDIDGVFDGVGVPLVERVLVDVAELVVEDVREADTVVVGVRDGVLELVGVPDADFVEDAETVLDGVRVPEGVRELEAQPVPDDVGVRVLDADSVVDAVPEFDGVPVPVPVPVREGVCDGVPVPEFDGVCDGVRELDGVPVELSVDVGDPDAVAVDESDGDFEGVAEKGVKPPVHFTMVAPTPTLGFDVVRHIL